MKKIPSGQKLLVSGFTLLEVLMVVLVVGIISGIVMLNLNFGGAERHLQDEADRLIELVTQAANEAVVQNQEYGLKLTTNGYFFLCLDEPSQRWKPCPQDSSFRQRELPEGLEIHLLRESKMLLPLSTKLGTDKPDAAEAKTVIEDSQKNDGPRITPDIFLLSSGEASAASLDIQVTDKPELKVEIKIDDIGRVSREGDATDAADRKEAKNAQ
jgi:general secretion pathway protein H